MEMTTAKQNAAIDLTVTMVAAEIAEQEHRDPSEVLCRFLSSKTAQMLYDDKMKLWWNGPSDIVRQYRREQNDDTRVKRTHNREDQT